MPEILMRHESQGKDDEPIVARTERQARVYERSGWKRLPKSEQQKEGGK